MLLVGGGVASVRCARTLRRHGFDGSILLVGVEDRAPYNRPPLSKELLRADLPDELLDAEPASWYEKRSIELLTGVPVTAIEADARRATHGRRLDPSASSVAWWPPAPSFVGSRSPAPSEPSCFGPPPTRDGSARPPSRLAAAPGSSWSAGASSASRWPRAWLASACDRPSSSSHPPCGPGRSAAELAAWAASRLASVGVELRLGSAVTGLAAEGVWLGDERLPAELVVAGIGVLPRDELAAAAGIATDGGIVCDAQQRTSHAAIWAAGDVARVDGLRVEHWHAAREAGERAALSMLGLDVPAPPPPWVFSEVGGAMLDVIGAVSGWDDERWIAPERLLAYLRAGRVVGLASIDGAMPADACRRLVAGGASIDEVAAAAG